MEYKPNEYIPPFKPCNHCEAEFNAIKQANKHFYLETLPQLKTLAYQNNLAEIKKILETY